MGKALVKSVGECTKCHKNTFQRRAHKPEQTRHLNRQPFYFTEWDYCVSCHLCQLYEKYKVWNNNEAARDLKNLFEEQEKLDFIRNI